MYGKVVTVRHQAVTRKKDNRFAVALDSEQNNIHVKDIVKVIDGPHSVSISSCPSATPEIAGVRHGHKSDHHPFLIQGREGEIRHLFRSFAFLHCKKLVENGGMFVCKTRHLVLAGGSKVRWVWWRPGSAPQPSLALGATTVGSWRIGMADVRVGSLAEFLGIQSFSPNHSSSWFYCAPVGSLTLEIRQRARCRFLS